MEKIVLDQVIHKELITIDSKAGNKDEVLRELVHLLYQNDYISDEAEFLKDVYLREMEGETGIGQGIAIPHGKSLSVKTTTIAVAKLAEPIEWETLDGEAVQVVIMFAVKDSDVNTTHVLLLQQVATLLADELFLDDLKGVTSVDEMYQLVTNK
ncbi:putative PTS system, fructose-specific enzyme IIA component [Listeria floridensis FSL S10-1187]|uniref:PTS system, fructose-specific enzyme IIA component n=1 Tax=Listeria floridensis FSL S10-1187 TaxID=1265817 RepID=A0ABN0RFN8_9LIST|nr:fructose PTS transporter subunit IIA [Listeria floridensis]EUJ32281.1 putative PTS system, fructose-specific enzyme IIA component [Listeria floridensis FSL S10-1187]